MANDNPWKGLNFYVETDIIYGRDAEIASLSNYIFNNTQTVLYGRSGIGKSSILNAGIFPLARRMGMIPVTVRFKHSDDDSYITQIQEALLQSGITIEELVPVIDPKNETLWEFIHRHRFLDANSGEETVPLIVFDQFEEIFTLQRSEKNRKQFFNDLADLFNDVKPLYVIENENREHQARSERSSQSISSGVFKGLTLSLNLGDTNAKENGKGRNEYVQTPNYHIVFALREDFLSSLEMYSYNIPVMRNNRFPLQPINDEQAAEIIMKPRPGLVDVNVAKLIIQKVTGEENFEIDGKPEIQVDSAILSLYLSSLYDKMEAAGEAKITAELVEAHSDNIIEDFYSGAVKGLPEKAVEWLEDTLVNEDGRRDNRDKSTVMRESGLTEEQYDNLVYNAKLLRQFSYGGDLRVEFIHDVLCPVIMARKSKRAEDERVRRIEQAAREQKRRARRNRNWIVAAFLILAAIWGGIMLWNYVQYDKEVAEYYTDFTLRNGWPEGIGKKLTEKERQHTPLYYKISKKGRAARQFTDIEICSSNTMLPAGNRLDWVEFAHLDATADTALNRINSNVRYLRFTGGSELSGKDTVMIAKTELLDSNRKNLLTLSYFHTKKGEAWIQYLSPKGNAFPIRKNGIDRSFITWDDSGRLTSQRFFTSEGDVQPLDENDKIAGFAWEYPAESPNTTIKYYLNRFGQPTQDKPFNRRARTMAGDTTITEFTRVLAIGDPNPVEATDDGGYSKLVTIADKELLYRPGSKDVAATCLQKKDSRGNIIEQTIEGYTDAIAPVITWKYKGETGLVTERKALNADGTPHPDQDNIYLTRRDYDRAGNLISEVRTQADGKVPYRYIKTSKTAGNSVITSERLYDEAAHLNFIKEDTIRRDGSYHATAYYDAKHNPVNHPILFGYDSISSHLIVSNIEKQTKPERTITTTKYFVEADGRIIPLPTILPDETNSIKAAFCRRVITDAEGNMTNLQVTDKDGHIVTRMVYLIQNGQVVGRAASSIIDGSPVRCPNWEEEGFGCYAFYFSKNFSNRFTYLKPFDEWANPSVISDEQGYFVVKTPNFKGEKLINGGEISYDYYQSILEEDVVTPIALPYLHILSTSSSLYKKGNSGLTDGDRLIAIGNWKYGDEPKLLAAEWQKLTDPSKSVNITVLRPASKPGVFSRISRTIAGDSAEAPRSEYHIMSLSPTEADLIKSYL